MTQSVGVSACPGLRPTLIRRAFALSRSDVLVERLPKNPLAIPRHPLAIPKSLWRSQKPSGDPKKPSDDLKNLPEFPKTLRGSGMGLDIVEKSHSESVPLSRFSPNTTSVNEH
uniref:Uncharacterized protein n=1 Tax=Lygus hesperus TaxID=30085 RepID=A0A146MCW3_LYGHE